VPGQRAGKRASRGTGTGRCPCASIAKPLFEMASRSMNDPSSRLALGAESVKGTSRRLRLSISVVISLLLAACAAPVQVDRVDLRSAYDELNRTALSGDQLSEFTRTVLRRAALLDYFDAQPDATIV